MFRSLTLLVFLVSSFWASAAYARDYTKATWPNLVRTLVRFNALDLSDQYLLDEYTIVTDCEIYKAFYSDDFKWNKVRQAVRESIKMNLATFPANYFYDIKMQLGRYDFNSQIFRFAEKSTLRNVNTFVLYAVQGDDCGTAKIKLLPRIFRAVIATPIYLEGLPLSDKDAQALLDRMQKSGNDSRLVYARFNLRTIYIEPMRKIGVGSESNGYQQTNQELGTVRIDVTLDSIDFYEDDTMTKLIYEFKT